jgi:hypothetical protein
MDLLARKPKPTNRTPGLIYMLCGAHQHSYTDPFDQAARRLQSDHLDADLAFRGRRRWHGHRYERCGYFGYVRWNNVCASPGMRVTVGRP